MIKVIALLLVLGAIIGSQEFVQAAEGHGSNCTSCHKLNEKEASELLRKLGVSVNSVRQAPVKGFFELLVEKDGKKGLLFLDYAKKRIVQGTVFSLDTLQPIAAHPLDQFQPKQATTIDPSTIPVESAFIIGNSKGSKKIYVFTDPDCPFCHKMHVELRKLEKIAPDVAIHVMLYPLPMHPAAFDKARVVLEMGSQEVLDKAFSGKELPKPTRDESRARIDRNIRFAKGNGISGTPTMVMLDGKIVVGVRDAEELKKMLEGMP
jgi:thiol:disulfide interchange protein DsbC